MAEIDGHGLSDGQVQLREVGHAVPALLHDDVFVYSLPADVDYLLAACIDAEHACGVNLYGLAFVVPLVASFSELRLATEIGSGELVGDDLDGIAGLPVCSAVEQAA